MRLAAQPAIEARQRGGMLVPAQQVLKQVPASLAGDVGEDVGWKVD